MVEKAKFIVFLLGDHSKRRNLLVSKRWEKKRTRHPTQGHFLNQLTTSGYKFAERKLAPTGGILNIVQGNRKPIVNPYNKNCAVALSCYLLRKSAIFSTLTGVLPFF